MECKWIRKFFVLAVTVSMVLSEPLSVFCADETAVENVETGTEIKEPEAESDTETGSEAETPDITVKPVQKEKIPVMSDHVTLTPDSVYYLDFREVGKKAEIDISSDHSKVVTVGEKGKLIPKKCGNAAVTVTVTNGSKIQKTVIRVHVKYDRFLKVKNYGKAWKKTGNSKSVQLYLHHSLKK